MTGRHQRLFFPFLIFIFALPGFAKNPAQKGAPVDPSRYLQVTYANEKLNKDPKTIDSAYVFFRDRKTGKIAKIFMSETAPDSSVFRGLFNVSWGTTKSIVPQIFILPPSLQNKKGTLTQFKQMLKQRKISRKPLVLKRNPDGIQILDVYDTKAEAKAAAKEYKEILKAKRMQNIGTTPNAPNLPKSVAKRKAQIPKRDALEAAKTAARLAALAKAAKSAEKREEERLRKEKLEKKKREEAKKKAQQLARAERERRKKEAAMLAQEALKKYRAQKYNEAEELFRQSSELDPENTQFYFQYGVTLFRNNKLDDALVKFGVAETSGRQDIEKQYFMGLAHFKLNEFDQASIKFSQVKESKDPVLGPSGAFYKGIIHYNKEEFRTAQPEFEHVLDTSKDPKLDDKAEEYIEKIIRHLQFQKLQEKPHTVSVTTGLEYDSNVLLSADNSDSGSSTEEDSIRYLVGGNYTYRAIYKRTYDLSVSLDVYYKISQNTDVASADPLIYSLGVPYSYKTTIGNKPYILKLTPGYESLSLDAEATQTSVILDIGNTIVMNGRWISTYDLEFRQDDNLTDDSGDDSAGDDNADATKIVFTTTHTYFLDEKKTKGVIGTLGYTSNAAEGDNKAYTRFDLGLSYLAPTPWWEMSFIGGVSYYSSDYTSDRADTNTSASLALSKVFSPLITGAFNLGYNKNDSTDDASTYTQYTALFSATFNWTF